MIEITYMCDRCGAKSNDAPLKFIGYTDFFGKQSFENKEFGLCDKCVKEINAFAFKKILPSTVKQTEEKPEKEAKKIDMNKAVALRKAGWSYKAIADELKIKYKTLYDQMAAYEMKNGKIDYSDRRKPLEFNRFPDQASMDTFKQTAYCGEEHAN